MFGEIDPVAGPLAFFGAELRRWRRAAGLSLEHFGPKVGYSGALVAKVETGERAPTADFARHCDEAVRSSARPERRPDHGPDRLSKPVTIR